jgi:hypothetical protein
MDRTRGACAMKLQEIVSNPYEGREVIRRWIAMAVWAVAALIIADWIATEHMLRLAALAGIALGILVAAGMQRKAWLLIIVGYSFKGSIEALPVPLSVYDVMVLLATFSYILQRFTIGPSTRRPLGVLDWLLGLNCALMAVTFLCHPVGLRSLGSRTIGAASYFNIFIACCAFWVMVHLPDSYRSVSRIPLWLMAGMSVSTLISVAVYVFPSITPYVWYFYSSVDISEYMGSLHVATVSQDEPQVKRLMQLAPFGLMLVQFLSAYYPPRTLLNPLRWRFYLFVLGIAAVLASGFRNTLLFAIASLVLGCWFHRGWREVIVGGATGLLLLALVVFGQGRFYQLPLPAQRALSFLPGQWAEPIEGEVKASNSRFEWWRQILEEDSIKNWWLGDGFGVSEADYELFHGRTGSTEWLTLTGTLHNGPLTTIRYAGVIGLVLFYALMIAAAIQSVKCVQRCRGTPLLPLAIFLAIQLVWIPIHYTFAFGSFNEQLPEHIFLIGLLLLVWNMSVIRQRGEHATVMGQKAKMGG